MDIVEKARVFATAAHAAVAQLRKYTNEPYIVHPAEVARIVSTVPHTPEMLAASWLHDTVEDTGITIEIIRAEFGTEVAELVGWLTKVSRKEQGNRATRAAIDRAHLAMAPADAQTVKLADILANTSNIAECDPKFAKTYLAEKRQVIDVMTKGDAVLLQKVRQVLDEN